MATVSCRGRSSRTCGSTSWRLVEASGGDAVPPAGWGVGGPSSTTWCGPGARWRARGAPPARAQARPGSAGLLASLRGGTVGGGAGLLRSMSRRHLGHGLQDEHGHHGHRRLRPAPRPQPHAMRAQSSSACCSAPGRSGGPHWRSITDQPITAPAHAPDHDGEEGEQARRRRRQALGAQGRASARSSGHHPRMVAP